MEVRTNAWKRIAATLMIIVILTGLMPGAYAADHDHGITLVCDVDHDHGVECIEYDCGHDHDHDLDEDCEHDHDHGFLFGDDHEHTDDCDHDDEIQALLAQINTATPTDTPDDPAGEPDFEDLTRSAAEYQLASGSGHTIVLLPDGTVWSYGKNDKGQLGLGHVDVVEGLSQIEELTDIVQIAAGKDHALALSADGEVYAWGLNGYGQLGDGTKTDSNEPVAVDFFADMDIVQIAAGGEHSLALTADGEVYTWGYNGVGQLGVGYTSNDEKTPLLMDIDEVVQIEGGGYVSLMRKADGTLWSVGQNAYGQLGDGTTTRSTTPVQVVNLADVIDMSAGEYHNIAVTANGTVYTWGAGWNGRLGLGHTEQQNTVATVTDLPDNIVRVEAGSSQTVALTDDGLMYIWGPADYGQLGLGWVSQQELPVLLAALEDVVAVGTGNSHTHVITVDGKLWSFGKNTDGQLGITGDNSNIPVLTYDFGKVEEPEEPEQPATPTDQPTPEAGYQIVSGESHTLALMEDGTVWAFGANTYGQLGLGFTSDGEELTQIEGLEDIVMVTAARDHSLALKSDGTVYAWGRNNHGQLGDGTTDDNSTPTVVAGLSDIVSIGAGLSNAYAVGSDGSAYGWGYNYEAQCGTGHTSAYHTTPQLMTIVDDVKKITAGQFHVLVLKTDGAVWGFGYAHSQYGQLGEYAGVQRQLVPLVAEGAVDVAAGEYTTTVLMEDGTVYTMGRNSSGQLGLGHSTHTLELTQVEGLPTIVGIAVSSGHMLAVDETGAVWSWGDGSYGTLGIGSTSSKNVPQQVLLIDDAVGVSAGHRHSHAITADGGIWSWGYNNENQLGVTTQVPQAMVPMHINAPEPEPIEWDWGTRISSSGYHTVVAMDDGTVWSFGKNDKGQLGLGFTSDNEPLTQIPGLTDVIQVAAGEYHSLALKDDGTVWAWGDGWEGQLGSGTQDSSTSPVQVSGLTDIVYIAAGERNSFAVDADGNAWSWGYNWEGQLAKGPSSGSSLSPGQVNTGSIVKIAAGRYHTLVLRNDGTLWGYGHNSNNALGNISARHGTLLMNDIVDISAGEYQSVAVTTEGEVYTFGRNAHGQLGHNETTNAAVPGLVEGLPAIVAVDAGYEHMLALAEDGTIWAWGRGTSGELGDGEESNSLTPVQVSTLDNTVAISAGYDHSHAITDDGHVWSWGSNYLERLGLPYAQTVRENEPIRITEDPIEMPQLHAHYTVSAGYGNTLVLMNDGTVWRFGASSDYEQISGLTDVVQISAYAYHYMALKSDGTVWTWGSGDNGRLGHGNTTSLSVPTQVAGLTNIVDIEAGQWQSFAIRADGKAYGWGYAGYGQLGVGGSTAEYLTPVAIPLANVVKISSADQHTLFLLEDGNVYSTGINTYGQLGYGDYMDMTEPIYVTNNAIDIATGSFHSMILKSDGRVWSAGFNGQGQLGIGGTTSTHLLTQVDTDVQFVSISSGLRSSFGITTTGDVYAWGMNDQGQLGIGSTADQVVATATNIITGVVSVTTGLKHSAAITSGGAVWVWGDNTDGMMGYPTTLSRGLVPTRLMETDDHPDVDTNAVVRDISIANKYEIEGFIQWENDVDWIAIRPDTTGTYRVSLVAEGVGVYYEVYDAEMEELAAGTLRSYALTADEVYYVKIYRDAELDFARTEFTLHVEEYDISGFPLEIQQGLVANEGKTVLLDEQRWESLITEYFTYYDQFNVPHFCYYESTYGKEKELEASKHIAEKKKERLQTLGLTQGQTVDLTEEDYEEILYAAPPPEQVLEDSTYISVAQEGWTELDAYNFYVEQVLEMMGEPGADNIRDPDIVAAIRNLGLTRIELEDLYSIGGYTYIDLATMTRMEIDDIFENTDFSDDDEEGQDDNYAARSIGAQSEDDTYVVFPGTDIDSRHKNQCIGRLENKGVYYDYDHLLNFPLWYIMEGKNKVYRGYGCYIKHAVMWRNSRVAQITRDMYSFYPKVYPSETPDANRCLYALWGKYYKYKESGYTTHQGIDMENSPGTIIRAGVYGTLIKKTAGTAFVYVYQLNSILKFQHLDTSTCEVQVGEPVTPNAKLGVESNLTSSGDTGIYGPHTHINVLVPVRDTGKAYNLGYQSSHSDGEVGSDKFTTKNWDPYVLLRAIGQGSIGPCLHNEGTEKDGNNATICKLCKAKTSLVECEHEYDDCWDTTCNKPGCDVTRESGHEYSIIVSLSPISGNFAMHNATRRCKICHDVKTAPEPHSRRIYYPPAIPPSGDPDGYCYYIDCRDCEMLLLYNAHSYATCLDTACKECDAPRQSLGHLFPDCIEPICLREGCEASNPGHSWYETHSVFFDETIQGGVVTRQHLTHSLCRRCPADKAEKELCDEEVCNHLEALLTIYMMAVLDQQDLASVVDFSMLEGIATPSNLDMSLLGELATPSDFDIAAFANLLSSDVCYYTQCTHCREIFQNGHTYRNDPDYCDRCGGLNPTHTHFYPGACDTNCAICNYPGGPGHSYSSGCDRYCNRCGVASGSTIAHSRDYCTEGFCKYCLEFMGWIDHAYSNPCTSLGCSRCPFERESAPGHHYPNLCDPKCGNCSNTDGPGHEYSSSCDRHCNKCGALRSSTVSHQRATCEDGYCMHCQEFLGWGGKHNYPNPCTSTICISCGVLRQEPPGHSYPGACDVNCANCGYAGGSGHLYSSNCDRYCNRCGVSSGSTVAHYRDYCTDGNCKYCGEFMGWIDHTYANPCTSLNCSKCSFKRNVASGHKYYYDCSQYCYVCGGGYQNVGHSYDYSCSKYCRYCGGGYQNVSHSYSSWYGSWVNHSVDQHKRTAYCDCGNYIVTYANHGGTWGGWTNYDDGQHRRSKYCSSCETTLYSYGSHANWGSWSSWVRISGTYHQRNRKCGSCSYREYAEEKHDYNTGNMICWKCSAYTRIVILDDTEIKEPECPEEG